MMRLHKVQFKHVLSFSTASLTLDHHVTALIGPNDAGKSNILRLLDRLTGPTPSLQIPRDIRSWFSADSDPGIELSFAADENDRKALSEITGIQGLPSNSFPLFLSCRDGSMDVRVGDQSRAFSQQEGEEILKRLLGTSNNDNFFVELIAGASRP
jgi:predicted ATP-dependent endonuclease of OLD family